MKIYIVVRELGDWEETKAFIGVFASDESLKEFLAVRLDRDEFSIIEKEVPDETEQLTKLLSAERREGLVDLRYSQNQWAVMVPFGNTMHIVPGSINPSSSESLKYCLKKWRERSPDYPFLFGTEEGRDAKIALREKMEQIKNDLPS